MSKSTGLKDTEKILGKTIKGVVYKSAVNKGKQIAKLSSELQRIFKEHSEKNWDGYEAEPISKKSRDYTKRFLETILLDSEFVTLPEPDLIPNPDGLIDAEWENEDESMSLTITFHNNGKISYGFVNSDKTLESECFGSFLFNNKGIIPRDFSQLLKLFS